MTEIPPWGDWQAFRDQTAAAVEAGDPIGMLLAEHDWLRSIISETEAELQQGASISTAERRDQQAVIWGFIDAHIRKEEQAVFPVLQELFDANGMSQIQTETMYGEHDAIRIRYDGLQEALDTGGDLPVAFRHLWKALVVHFDNEEEYIFEDAQSLVTQAIGHDLIQRLTSGEFEPQTSPS